MKKQVVVIHGGHPFNKDKDFLAGLRTLVVTAGDFLFRIGWKDNLQKDLGEGFEVFCPKMPNKESAKYEEWQVWFEKMFPFLNGGIVLIGHSLGGLFLVKYLSENTFPQKIKALILIAAPAKSGKYNRSENFWFSGSLNKIAEQVKNIFLFYSKDDQVVSYTDFEKYKSELPTAKLVSFENKGHFRVDSLPELIEIIREQKI